MEQIADVCGAQPKWFQLYWGKSDELVASLLEDAADARHVVVTPWRGVLVPNDPEVSE